MFPLRRAVIRVVNRLAASPCGCHTISKPTNLRSLYFPFQLAAPALSKPETQLSSRNLPLPYVLFQSSLPLQYLLNVSHIDPMFPYSHWHRINLYFYYSLLGSLQYPPCPLSITPEHPPTLMLPELFPK